MPHVGMWIETCARKPSRDKVEVMPHVGMWIETAQMARTDAAGTSHASRRHVD